MAQFHITRTLNGVPISDEEMKNISLLRNEEIRELVARIKARILAEHEEG